MRSIICTDSNGHVGVERGEDGRFAQSSSSRIGTHNPEPVNFTENISYSSWNINICRLRIPTRLLDPRTTDHFWSRENTMIDIHRLDQQMLQLRKRSGKRSSQLRAAQWVFKEREDPRHFFV